MAQCGGIQAENVNSFWGLIVLGGADVVHSRGHGDLVESLGEEFVGLLVGDSGQDHDLGARLFRYHN